MLVRSQLSSKSPAGANPGAEVADSTGQLANLSRPASDAHLESSTGNAGAWLFLIAITAATLIAYSPVLFNFFLGDDFVHLTWLRYAIDQPELIWRNFHASWLDGTTTKFYRPLISIFMVMDYAIWRANGLGFHLTNLFFHLASSLLLFCIVRDGQKLLGSVPRLSTALLAAAMFALYPLHPEAVSWITGRVDTIVTAFVLGSIYGYLHWRQNQKPLWLMASLLSFVLGLLSKEMAITVPCVIVLFELMAPNRSWRRLFGSAPYWILLAAYFGVRKIALGTFVGGYDDSLLFVANIKQFILNWIHALRVFVAPINRDIMGPNNVLSRAWDVVCIISGLLLLWRFRCEREGRVWALFLAGWLALSLLPVYKLFAIAGDLQGSRLAYLATAPLSALFAYALTSFSVPTKLRTMLPMAVCALAAVLLWINNQPWRQAGFEANAIRNSLQSIYTAEKGDPQTLLLGMPDNYKGAYISRNALWGMTKVPQLDRDIWNCLMLNEFDPVHPFGFLKASLAEHRDEVKIYRWDREAGKFTPVSIESATASTHLLPQRDVEIVQVAGNRRPELTFQMTPASCWNADFVAIELEMVSHGTADTGADLVYANDLQPELQLAHRTHADLLSGQKHQRLIFALRSLPQWSFGTSDARLKLLLPPNSRAKLLSAEVVPAAELIPSLSFENSGYMGTKGYMHFGKDVRTRTLHVAADTVRGAMAAEIEITRPNMFFEEQNSAKQSAYLGKKIDAPLKGTIELRQEQDFPAGGMYELRVWAKDSNGNLLGRASDHIVISVDR